MVKQGSTNTVIPNTNSEAVEDQVALNPDRRRRAGHYEILGETHAKYEFFHNGWNPYSRFLDVDKVDVVLRRTKNGVPTYREVQVKFGKLYPVNTAWERQLFDMTSWRFFKANEFDGAGDQLFVAYVLAADDAYRGDIFIFPVRVFASIIAAAPITGGKHRVFISRCKDNSERWVLRRTTRFDEITEDTCVDVSQYRRNFRLFDTPGVKIKAAGWLTGIT